MRKEIGEVNYWGHVSQDIVSQQFDEALAEQYRQVHLDLILKWTNLPSAQAILKTDLFAEALCPQRAFMWDLLRLNSNVTAIDISADITGRTRTNTQQFTDGKTPKCVTCDIRKLPFDNSAFDLILSDSTLDHFENEHEIIIALSELKRILKPGGTLVITMDNKGNITDPLFRLWIRLGLAPFYIGKTFSIKSLKKSLVDEGFYIDESTAIIHNPRLITKKLIVILRKIAPAKSNAWIRKLLIWFDSHENKKTKYLTAQFIAVKAKKPVI
jgi:SAM-dependent methyltransferase